MPPSPSSLFHRVSPETVAYVVLWAVIMLIPVLQQFYDLLTDVQPAFEWRRLLFTWVSYVPFLLIFLLSKLVYEPKLFFRGRHMAYFLVSFVTAFVFVLVLCYVFPHRMPSPPRPGLPLSLPPEGSPAPPFPPPPIHTGIAALLRGPFLPRLLMALLMMGSSVAFKGFFRAQRDRLRYEEQLSSRLQSELDYLKYQINPHFFMNTLNNIHALVDIDSERAKQSIIELSHLMRYLLYESDQPTVPLRRELTFVRHYLELMKIRCDESVALTYEEPQPGSPLLEASVPPLILLTFIENAFKHGISHRQSSYIRIRIAGDGGRLHFHCDNSRFPVSGLPSRPGGVGLAGVKRRLQLLYPDSHTLRICPDDNTFTVDLWLPL